MNDVVHNIDASAHGTSTMFLMSIPQTHGLFTLIMSWLEDQTQMVSKVLTVFLLAAIAGSDIKLVTAVWLLFSFTTEF